MQFDNKHKHKERKPESETTKKNGKSKHKRKNKTKVRPKKYRDLSRGNAVVYKGVKGFNLIKKYRSQRRNESYQLRQQSLGSVGLHGTIRSRNKSSEGFFSTLRSWSSDARSAQTKEKNGGKAPKTMKGGFYTRNKLNEKFKAINEARKKRLQKSLNKLMKFHVNHLELNVPLSRQSSGTPCDWENQVCKTHEAFHCAQVSSGAVNDQKSFDRNFWIYTPKISVGENDFAHYSRNYEENWESKREYEKQNEEEILKVSNRKYDTYNSHKVSPQTYNSMSKPNTVSKTENTSFADQNIRIYNMKNYAKSKHNSVYFPLKLHHKQISSIVESKQKIVSDSKTISHTAASSMNTAKAQF